MAKVIIYLPDHESAALNELAQREYRVPKAQAALIIRKELMRLGMIPEESEQALQGTKVASHKEAGSSS